MLPSSPLSPAVIGLRNGLQGRLLCGDSGLEFRGVGTGTAFNVEDLSVPL